MRQILVVILSAFVTILASVSAGNGSCRDFTYGGCALINIYETVNDMNTTICQKFCQDIFTERCQFWSLDYKQKVCNLYDSQFDAFSLSCSRIGGPPMPKLSECQSDPCNKFEEGYCNYQGIAINETTTSDSVACQTKCSETSGCQYFVFNKEFHNCVLLNSAERVCDFVRGPPTPPIDSC